MATQQPTSPALALLQDVEDNFGTLKKALGYVAAQTNRSFSSLRVAYHRSRRGKNKRHAQDKLSSEQEAVLVFIAQAFNVNNVALSGTPVRELVLRKWGVSVPRNWVRIFVGHHRGSLSKQACKTLEDKRAGQQVFDGVFDFRMELKDFLNHCSFPNHAVFNFDKTRLVQKNAKLVLRRIEAANKERTNLRSTRNRTVPSLLTFDAANRSVLLSVYILEGRFRDSGEATVDFNLEHAPRVTRGIWPPYYVWNDTRYLDADKLKPVLTKGAEEFHALYPCMSSRLFGDQLAAHRRADIVEFATLLDLFLFFLVKNTSHITQPLDEAPFATLQADRVRRNEVAIMDGMLTSTSSRDTLLMAACEAECRAFSRPIIIAAFRRRGLWPFDADLVKANVRANLGLADSGGTAADAARHAATMVIQAGQDRVDQSKT